MNLNDAKILAELHMEAHGLINQNWRFAFHKSNIWFGLCRYSQRLITLSKQLVELNAEADVEQTILHEIAHALVGGIHHHDRIWKRKAIEIGASGNRCYPQSVVTPPARWNLVCDSCGKKYPRQNKTAMSRSCGYCSKKFNSNFILRWERNEQNNNLD